MKAPDPKNRSAFSRVEVLIVICALALLTTIVLPALASPRVRSQRVLCANNLRQIGSATLLWGNDHGDLPPYAVVPAEGGTRGHPLAVNPWLHFSWLSNQLASPVVFLCPSDTGRPARDFGGDPTGGYVHPNFANRATSYFLGHMGGGPGATYLTGDRNMGWESRGGQCPPFVGPVFTAGIRHPRFTRFLWNTNLHFLAGNILFTDGRVEQLSNSEVPGTLSTLPDYNADFHFITPR